MTLAPEWTKMPIVVSKPDFKMIMKLAKKGDGFKYADKTLKNGYIGELEGIVYGMPPKV